MDKNKKVILSEFERGYWCAVQNVVSLYVRPDRQTAEQLIKESGFNRDTCLALINNSPFNGDVLADIVEKIYPR